MTDVRLKAALMIKLKSTAGGLFAMLGVCFTVVAGDDHIAQNGASIVYLREATIEYFGVRREVQTALSFRRDVSLCTVSPQDGRFVSVEQSVSSAGTNEKLAKRFGMVRSRATFRLKDGQLPLLAKEAFNIEMPFSGLETFFLPMLSPDGNGVTLDPIRLITMQTAKEFSPSFTGSWVCDYHRDGGTTHICGPFLLATAGNGCIIAGAYDHEVSLKPLVIREMATNAIIKFTPTSDDIPTALLNPEQREWAKEYDTVVGRFKVLMVPAKSDRAKGISVPDELLAK